MELRGKQKRFLRSAAHHMQPLCQIGKGGLTDSVLDQIEDTLDRRELIKVSLLQNTDEVAEEVAEVLEREIGCDVVQVIGRILVVFKPSSREKYQKISVDVRKI
ncbi:ribosome assembly RNA-binding protein YhbY [Vagococcus coleopterorum]|uniref:Ribosome assembly RNA-binding protein YhbY n=1 Tax=Vagococcus coleopterorum TaxID=2714946 RepID=A0A6G8AMS4_9ENTE|nr:ribosome assembly RNA-binding protein YhbY [Vagococcus coleopterorum]QIL46381.1 ribosome assembly RNA-binding protein YhbY [Vagococcus coleopterorum]